jgi:hypothetical protein
MVKGIARTKALALGIVFAVGLLFSLLFRLLRRVVEKERIGLVVLGIWEEFEHFVSTLH